MIWLNFLHLVSGFLHFIFIFFWIFGCAYCKVNPLSRVVITSMKALVHKEDDCPEGVIASYQDDVRVSLADGSEMTADKLNILMRKKMVADGPSISVKYIELVGNVRLKRTVLTAQADHMKLMLPEQDCFLEGNVRIVKGKEKSTDIPLNISGFRGKVNLLSLDATLVGSTDCPVQTIVDLNGYPGLQKKLKKERKA